MAEIDVYKLILDRVAPLVVNIDLPGFSPPRNVQLGSFASLRVWRIKLIPISVDYSEIKPDALPVEVLRQTYFFRNCSSSPRKEVKSATLTWTEGYSISKTDFVSNTTGATLGFDIYGVKVGVSAAETVNFNNQETINKQTTKTETITFDETINPYTDLNITIQKRINRAYLDFSGIVEAEADIGLALPGGAHGYEFPISKLSELTVDRRFSVAGQIWNGRAEDYSKEYQEIKYSEETCPGAPAPDPTPLMRKYLDG